MQSLTGLGLAPLEYYGGPTQTMALFPGSPALGKGAAPGRTADQRGRPLDSPEADIGAFQSQGFFLIVAAGASPQSAPTGEVFGNPLAVTVTARNPVEPVVGGVVSFAVTPEAGSGAAANLSAAVALVGVDHRALVTARANANEGSYIVTASTAGGLAMPQLLLTNIANDLVRLQFTGLSNETIVFGTATATFTGVLANGTEAHATGRGRGGHVRRRDETVAHWPRRCVHCHFCHRRARCSWLAQHPQLQLHERRQFRLNQHDPFADGNEGDADSGCL